MYASAGYAQWKAKADTVETELAKCQAALNRAGYLCGCRISKD